jgi:hypothetical protein
VRWGHRCTKHDKPFRIFRLPMHYALRKCSRSMPQLEVVWSHCGQKQPRSGGARNPNRKRWPVVENIQVWLPRHELNPRSHKHKCADPRHTCVITTNMQSRRGQYIFACNTGTVPSATRPFCVHFFPNESGGVLPSSTLCNSNHQRSFRMCSCKV